MKTELIIRSNSSDIDFALLKDGRLTALNNESNENKFSVGDVFLAKIGKVLSGLNASFVNVGYEKDGFLHYHDLGAQLKSLNKFIKGISTGKIKDYTLKNFQLEKDIDKNGSIADVLKTGQNLLVQIVKEPISTKGPRMSSEISIAGRYLVLVPFSDRVSVSQKIIDPEEKERLKRLIKSIKPKGFGVIIRTVAKDKKVADLDKDLQNSLERWVVMCKKIRTTRAPQTPIKVLSARFVGREYSNYKDITLRYKNVSNRRVSAIRFKWYGENAFNEPADVGGVFNNGWGGGFDDEGLGVGNTTSSNWSILSKDGKKILIAYPYEVAFTDGTKWELKNN